METIDKNKTISLRDIAKEADVSVSTVSRALSGDSRISSKIIDRVRAISAELGYTPKPLRRKTKDAIAVVVACDSQSEIRQKYLQDAIYYVECFASQFDYHVHVDFVSRATADLPTSVYSNRVDSVLIVGFPNVTMCKEITSRGIPAVVLDDNPSRVGCSCVSLNASLATKDLVSRLVKLGHRKIGAVVTSYSYPTVDSRFQAFYEAVAEAGLSFNNCQLVTGVEPNIIGGRQAVNIFKSRNEMPTAIVFTNDWMALGGLLELQRLGHSVPEDVSIAGYDNNSICDELFPRLTSIDICLEKMVIKACEILKYQVDDGNIEIIDEEIVANLIWRDSCIQIPEKG